MDVTSTGGSTTSGTSSAGGSKNATQDPAGALSGLSLDDFFKLMITEMSNQDPLNPLENHQLLQQVSQIQQYGATQQLTQTLNAVLMGQNLSNATSLIGKSISALTESGDDVQGTVDRVTMADNVVRVHIGDQEIKLENVREVLPSAT